MIFGMGLLIIVLIPLMIWFLCGTCYSFLVVFFLPADHPRRLALDKRSARNEVYLSDLAFWRVPEKDIPGKKSRRTHWNQSRP